MKRWIKDETILHKISWMEQERSAIHTCTALQCFQRFHITQCSQWYRKAIYFEVDNTTYRTSLQKLLQEYLSYIQKIQNFILFVGAQLWFTFPCGAAEPPQQFPPAHQPVMALLCHGTNTCLHIDTVKEKLFYHYYHNRKVGRNAAQIYKVKSELTLSISLSLSCKSHILI